MSPLKPLDTEFFDRFKKLERKQGNTGRTRQLYKGDWFVFSERFEYVTVQNGAGFRYGRIRFVNSTLRARANDFFTIGDKIYLIQNAGTRQYYYVTNITSTYIEIFGGSTYVLQNQPIAELGRALTATPIGHPINLTFAPQISAPVGTYNAGAGAGLQYSFSMNGRNVRMIMYDLGGSSISGNDSMLRLVLPVKAARIQTSFLQVLNNSATIGLSYVCNQLLPGTFQELGWIFRDVSETWLQTGTANHMGAMDYLALIS